MTQPRSWNRHSLYYLTASSEFHFLNREKNIFNSPNTCHASATPASGGAKTVLADYGNIEALFLLLEEHKVETVISTIGLMGAEAIQSQLNLIAAADKAKSTHRFVPSEFAVYVSPEDSNAAAFGAWLDAAAALKKTGLTYTRVISGWFMDYFGMPHTPSNLTPHAWAVDIANRRAAIPGTGNELMTMTYSVDVARFVVRMLDGIDWPEVSIISGSDTTFDKILEIAEKITDYGAGPASAEETQAMMALFGLMSVEGRILVPEDNRMNDKYPEIHPVGIEELLTEAWTGK
ncbi:hypothetical protein CSAL01_09892 [Colletotrichum salicis]|uniref:NmrA-like domain-containing protein n=1 Tax=Colletotrichum salicis TaxID=1209931 RepID=A0A135U9Q1_9PEZI|nr:hypothetical protein CSAL01_09892 [Colletotrichum salicis]